ncbi:hypothetical protein HMPREF3225_00885 [Staphylococcus lugdunensis]|uniref:Uncharacterized protein n=1 Tax=Staphylococcus lugdunensis TaxID=28035 RepID=A0ABD4EGP5_STALU|nr:hypothetical protein HMPREF3225_00885 [Staphylococcus lugdunensis]
MFFVEVEMNYYVKVVGYGKYQVTNRYDLCKYKGTTGFMLCLSSFKI